MRVAIPCGRSVNAFLGFALLTVASFSAPIVWGQTGQTQRRGFWVAGSAEVTVRADEAIVIMVVRASAPVASEAYARNEQITGAVEQTLEDLSLNGKYRFSGDQFDFARIPYAPVGTYIQPGRQSPFPEVTKYVFVTFDEPDLSNATFEQKLASTIASLTQAGATAPTVFPQGVLPQGIATVVFAVKEPGPALLEATAQAIDQAKSMGRETAKRLGVRITGVIDARINRPLEVALPRQQDLNVINELNLKYYSASKDQVTIPATCALEYSIK